MSLELTVQINVLISGDLPIVKKGKTENGNLIPDSHNASEEKKNNHLLNTHGVREATKMYNVELHGSAVFLIKVILLLESW